MSDTKRCARCSEVKSRSEFPPSKQRPDGLFNYCRPCKQAANREYQARYAADLSAKAKARYAANPAPAKARRRKRYAADPAKASAEAAAWNRANPARHQAAQKKWQQANMQGLVREATRRRYATRKGARAIKFTPDQLAQRAAYYGRRCWMCRAPMEEWDHVKPLTRGGWHCLSNLRPACRPCNARKYNTWPLART